MLRIDLPDHSLPCRRHLGGRGDHRRKILREAGSRSVRLHGYYPEQFYQPRLLRQGAAVHGRAAEVGLLSVLRDAGGGFRSLCDRAFDGAILQREYQRHGL